MATQSKFGFPFSYDPYFLREFVAFVKKYCHVGILNYDGLWTLASSVKGREVKFVEATSHYGRPSRESKRPWDRLNGQTLLRVQRNGLKENSR
jgi:hypothetical protein